MADSADSETRNNFQDAAGATDALPAGTVLGDYTILRVLGQGGFGVTYLALNRETNEQVVIKENLPTQFAGRGGGTLTVTSRGGRESTVNFERATQRFLDEARLLARLNHPNIVRVLRAFSALGTAYYVMPWVGGKDLKQFAAARGGVDEAFLRGVLSKLLPALSYLHSHNLLHRDIKPANILYADDGTPILIDFGTARSLVSERSQTMVESAGYTPMEQTQSHGNIGPWTDLYALGATLHTLVTGERPPRSSDRMGKTDCYVPLAGRAELRDKFGADFLEGIDKALAVWPEGRWQSADDWKSALLRSPVSSPPPPDSKDGELPREIPSKRAGEKGNGLRLAFLLLVVALIWGGYFMYRYNEPRHVIPSWPEEPPPPNPPDNSPEIEEPPPPIPPGYPLEIDEPPPPTDADSLYRKGTQLERESEGLSEAVNYYRRAAEMGHGEAQFRLAECYQNGRGTPNVDLVSAAHWYQKAAEQGHAYAQYKLGTLYSLGGGVARNQNEAVKWYRMAAEQGNAEAQCALGDCFVHGDGVMENLQEAKQWYRKAAQQGNEAAKTALSELDDEI